MIRLPEDGQVSYRELRFGEFGGYVGGPADDTPRGRRVAHGTDPDGDPVDPPPGR